MTSFAAAVVPMSGCLRDAMLAIDRSRTGMALAVDERHRLLGVLTDGDVRRALLSGASLDGPLEPHLVGSFVAVDAGASRGEVLELMQARRIAQVPVLDPDGAVVGLHLLHEMVGVDRRPNWAVVMAGGEGRRLRPLTESVPKPMLRVAGRPILERIVFHLVSHGIERVFLALGYRGEVIEAHFGDGTRFGCRVEYLREREPLGTAGALSLLPEPPSQPVVVMNGDLVTQADVGAMLDRHDQRGDTVTIAVAPYVHTVPYGCVRRSGDLVTAIDEKPTIEREINAGIYVLDPSVVARIPRDRPVSMPDVVADALERGERVGAFAVDDEWIDVGRRDELDGARQGR
ncbi:MAG TPA: nucleotidyltransferase family protein [Candidatus Limnocylindrales bacterium]